MMAHKSPLGNKRDLNSRATPSKSERIADLLMEMAREIRESPEGLDRLAKRQIDPEEMAAVVYSDRRRRDRVFGEGLFGEPCWDMMLELFVAAGKGNTLSTKSVTLGSAVPPTTALRWLENLESEGIVRRFADPDDKRRTCVELSASAHARMGEYLAETIAGLGTKEKIKNGG